MSFTKNFRFLGFEFSNILLMLSENLETKSTAWEQSNSDSHLPHAKQPHILVTPQCLYFLTLTPGPSLVWHQKCLRSCLPLNLQIWIGDKKRGDLPGGPVTRTPSSQSRGPRFNLDREMYPTCLLKGFPCHPTHCSYDLALPSKWIIFLKKRENTKTVRAQRIFLITLIS